MPSYCIVHVQFALDRAILGMRTAELAAAAAADPAGMQADLGSADPALLRVSVRPFPWPASVEDLGAASAAAFLNLLLVFAFLAPTRAAVVAVVRERELRLREGMKLLGAWGRVVGGGGGSVDGHRHPSASIGIHTP